MPPRAAAVPPPREAAGMAPRLASVDALRGITVAAMLLVNTPGDWAHVYPPLRHAAWHGCTPTDVVFPLFLFLVGVSAALALGPRLDRGDRRPPLARSVLLRAARMVGLGLLLHLAAQWAFDLPQFRVMGVLQRIGLCFALAAGAVLLLWPRSQWWLIAALLSGYAALLMAGGSLDRFDNLADRVDAVWLGAHAYGFDAATGRAHDPEGLLSTLGALATTLLGVRAGDALRRGDACAVWMGGGAGMVLGALWSLALPLNKALWTPSYALWTAGLAALLLAAAHALVDRRGWPPLGRAFGVNAIAAYVGSALLLYLLVGLGWLEPLYRAAFAGWMAPRFGPYLPSLAHALAFVALWWGVVRWLDARRIHVKV